MPLTAAVLAPLIGASIAPYRGDVPSYTRPAAATGNDALYLAILAIPEYGQKSAKADRRWVRLGYGRRYG